MADIKGLKELSRQLSNLEAKGESRIVAKAVRYSMQPVIRAARLKAPVGDRPHKTYKGRIVAPGYLKRNLRQTTRTKIRRGYVRGVVGARKEAFYGPLFVDLGTKRQRSNPFLRSSMAENKDEAIKRFKQRLAEEIRKAQK